MPEVIGALAVSKSYGDVRALREVTLSVEGPGVTGLLGPNGAGKSTLLALLTGLARPDAGALRLFGAPLGRDYPKRRVGVVLQDEAALDEMTAHDYARFFAAVYGIEGGAAKVLEEAGLAERARTPVERLSGGEAQRLFIAAACVHEPELLFLDEPTAHLDPGAKRAIGKALRDMGARRTVVFATHDLREAERLCDRAVFLVGGTVRAHGEVAALVAGVPPERRRGGGLEDAFFHYCGSRLTGAGHLEAEEGAGP